MSEQLVIDPARFAREGRRLRGILKVDALPRLAERVQDGSGEAAFDVEGYTTAKGHGGLHLAVSAVVALACQRCLEPLSQRIESRRDIVLVAGADEFSQSDDEAETEDVIPEVGRLDLRELVEDELLLSMPLAPHHDEGQCAAPASASIEASAGSSGQSPFAVLSRLKKP